MAEFNSDSNATLYTTTPVGSASVQSSESSNASSASVESSASSSAESSTESSTASSSAAEVSLANKPLDERTTVQNINDKTKNVTVVDTDGTKVSVQVQAPSYKKAQEIDALRTLVVSDHGVNGVRMTPTDFQAGLFQLFFNFEVDDKPAGKVNFELADSHRDAYKVFIKEATSFLDAIVNTD